MNRTREGGCDWMLLAQPNIITHISPIPPLFFSSSGSPPFRAGFTNRYSQAKRHHILIAEAMFREPCLALLPSSPMVAHQTLVYCEKHDGWLRPAMKSQYTHLIDWKSYLNPKKSTASKSSVIELEKRHTEAPFRPLQAFKDFENQYLNR